ncbi:MAG: acetyl-CoA carboxylase biotin carboxyl carrier protein subunit [Deltaproteobacteria bacterium]|nr:acetyl-CoA carboxylase biotin carboxyl carrier protein subunit [Deltaproteobacteria bacterium]
MTKLRYVAIHGKKTSDVGVTPIGGSRYLVELDGATHEVDALRFSGGNWSVIIDRQSYDVELEVAGDQESEGRYNTLVRGQVVNLTVQDERRRRMSMTSNRLTAAAPPVLTAPMAGKIVKVLVQKGQAVEEGTAVAIMEAMKMENELRVPAAGVVSEILVREGQAVEAGTSLIAFAARHVNKEARTSVPPG